ncbi:MAG: hypothetical protein AB1730_12030 [Myxococcota bacterium]
MPTQREVADEPRVSKAGSADSSSSRAPNSSCARNVSRYLKVLKGPGRRDARWSASMASR